MWCWWMGKRCFGLPLFLHWWRRVRIVQGVARGISTAAVYGRISAAEVEAEAAAQIEVLQSQGLKLTHIDTHKHTHMFPAVLRPVLRAARAAGIRAVRNPFEPAWAVHATAGASWARAAEVNVLRRLQDRCQQIIAEEGFATTNGTIAMSEPGS